MNDAFGNPQSIVVLGGTSDIAQAVLRRLARCRSVVLAGRDVVALESVALDLRRTVSRVATVPFDALTPLDTARIVKQCFEQANEPVDLVIVAVGELGTQEADESDPDRTVRMITVNFTWPAAALAQVAREMTTQGFGRVVVLSSVAGYRVRRANFLYGSAKAGLDAFAVGLNAAVRGTHVSVHVVRPGFVRTKMTAGRSPAPFAVGPDRTASDILHGLQRGQAVIWSPGFLRWVFPLLRVLPQSVWRRLPG